MNWLLIAAFVCVILQEVQILFLRGQIEDLETLFVNAVADKLKTTVFKINEDDGDEEDE
jgi:hypothetical protein